MLFIWFIYGLAFFVLGLAIFIYPKKGSAFNLANHIWLIACFGILHGINEWLDMFIVLEQPLPPHVLKFIRMVTLVLSFLFLLWFGTKVIAESKTKYRFLRVLPMFLFVTWAVIFIVSKQRLLIGDVWARYLLCAPGASLTAVALFLQIPQFRQVKLHRITGKLYLTAITFLVYALLAGVIVKKPLFPGISFLTYDAFKSVFGAPVQIFRALCAVVLAYGTIHILHIFRWETQEALRKSEQRCSAIASAAPIILFVQDVNSVVTFIEGKGAQLLGLSNEEIIGKRFSEIFPSNNQLDKDCVRALSGEEFVTNVTINDNIFETCYLPLRDNDDEIIGVMGVALDITANVQVETELKDYRRQIEKNARLAEIGLLSSTVAQQLDGPLSVTHLLLQGLQSDLVRISSDEATSNRVKRSLLEVSNAIEIVGKFRKTAELPDKSISGPIDLYQVAKRIVSIFAQSAQQANLAIVLDEIDVIPQMSISVHELEQIFFIMIQNAIDVSDIKKRQELAVSCNVEESQVELVFSDNCGGIEADKLRNVFEPFFAEEETQQKTSGLGLTIVKKIVNSWGGDIEVESQFGEGTVFRVRLPIEQIWRGDGI